MEITMTFDEKPKLVLGKGLEIELKPFHIGYENKKKTIGLNIFNRNKILKSKYKGFSFGLYLFDKKWNAYHHWIELIILNWIASLRINTLYGRKSFKNWKRKEGLI